MKDPLYVAYHDDEWGVPEYDPRALYEKLVLDGFPGRAFLDHDPHASARISVKRFDDFDPRKDRALRQARRRTG